MTLLFDATPPGGAAKLPPSAFDGSDATELEEPAFAMSGSAEFTAEACRAALPGAFGAAILFFMASTDDWRAGVGGWVSFFGAAEFAFEFEDDRLPASREFTRLDTG